MIFRFGRFELDEEAGELRRDGRPVAVQPKPLALLALLVRERARVVSNDELFATLWPGVAVTPGSLTRAVSLARRAIGDTHRGETLRSVARRGYRFTGAAIEIGGAVPAGAPRAAAAPAGEPAFVGRDDALDGLRAAWRSALDGRGGIGLVEGPPGIGKTRLAEVFAAEVERTGGLVLVGRCREGEGVPAFWLWAQVLRRLAADEAGGEALAELAGAPAELLALVSAGPRPGPAASAPDLAPEQSRFLLFDAVTRALARAARRRPLLLLLEDLQWAGSPSLRLLEHLSFEVGELPVLAIATVREEPRDPEHPLERLLPRLRQQPRCARIALRGFSRGEVAALLAHAIGGPPPPDLSSELYARTEGVPLFVREAIRLLAERGDLRHPERVRRWGVHLPARALDLIRRPLERLSAPAASAIAAAAVLGREFQGVLAAAVAGLERDAALDLLDEAARAGVVEPGETPGAWRFTHALFREAALQGLAAGARARLHLRAAAELERRHREDPDAVIAELAHHHHEALAIGDPERAFAVAQRAAERASRLLAHEQAAAHWTQAVAALEHGEAVDPGRHLAARLALGEAHRLAGDRERRRSVFGTAMATAQALGRPLERARAAIGYCDLSEWAPADEEARAALEAALAELPADAGVERARLLTRIAYLSARSAPERAMPRAREAVEQARAAGDPLARQEALYTLFFLLAGPDHLDEREALAREAEAVAREGGTADPSVIALLDLACDRQVFGDAEGARRWRAAAAELAGAEPHLGRVWHLRVYDAGLALLEGRFAEAERGIDEIARIGQRIEHPYARGVERALRAFLARERGDDAEVLSIFDPTRPIRIGPVQFVQAVVGRALLAVGRRAEAEAVFEDLLGAGAAAIPRNIRWYATIAEASLLTAEIGDEARARELLALLEPVADQHAVLSLATYGGPLARCLARLEESLGRLDRASDRFEEAEEAAAALGARPMRARILLEHGQLLARRGDRRRARERIGEAARLASALPMSGLEKAAKEAAAAL
jgi:DNA-binding winged helix-turn-helix (wHTH) protein/tetratricopeptide (TPR) repeat protein